MGEEMTFQGSGCGGHPGFLCRRRMFIASDDMHGVLNVANKIVDNFSDDAAAWGSAGSNPAKRESRCLLLVTFLVMRRNYQWHVCRML